MITESFETVASLAYDFIEAVPECACLYLEGSDILVPNEGWKLEFGDMSRLSDLARLPVDVTALSEKMQSIASGAEKGGPFASLDDAQLRSLSVTASHSHAGLFFLFLRDESEVRRVEQLRKDFIANVSHELRTPLTAVRGYVETLMDPAFMTPEHMKEFLPIIFEHTERLHNIVLDLLSLSRLENPNTRIELTPLMLADEIQDAVAATQGLARLKKIAICVEPPADSISVLANAEHLERVLVNLLDNAIKYSSPGDKVTIWTRVENGFVWTHLKDEGKGIAAEELGRVFERFYRTRGAVNGRARGSGLGLAIVKHIVQQLGGDISVTSILGEGSEFCFSLKLAEN